MTKRRKLATITSAEINELIDKATEEGLQKGREETRVKYNNYLQERYMSRDVERGTPTAEAILEVVRDLNNAFNEGIL